MIRLAATPRTPAEEAALAIGEWALREFSGERLVRDWAGSLSGLAHRPSTGVNELRLPPPQRSFFGEGGWGGEVFAAGKAAAAMARGVPGPKRGLAITKAEEETGGLDRIVSSHPHLDERALAAGQEMLDRARKCGPGHKVLFLLSGGASALMEAPRPGIPFEDLKAKYREWLNAGIPIEEMNRRRAEVSALKAGGLSEAFGDAEVLVLVLSDVRGNNLRAIGSGPLAVGPRPRPHIILADAPTLRRAAVRRFGLLEDPTWIESADSLRERIRMERAFVAVGEPLLAIPSDAPSGGRCQHIAALIAPCLPPGSAFLALAADGTDGPTSYAGALSVPSAVPETVTARYESTAFWESQGRVLTTGPTGTNLNDLFVFVPESEADRITSALASVP